MPTYNEPTKNDVDYHEPSAKGWFVARWFADAWFGKGKGAPSYTEQFKPDLDYDEPQWTGATWKNLKGITWKDIIGLTWKGLFEMFGNKISKPTYTETSKETVNYTEPSKE